MKMELLCLLMFVVTWIAYVKLQRFYKLERERGHKAYERRAADCRKLCEVRRRLRNSLRLRAQRRRR